MTDHDHDTDDLRERLGRLEADLQAAMALFTNAPAASFLLAADGRLHDVNTAACMLLGRTREALVGKTLGQFVPPAAQSTFIRLLGQAFEDDLRHHGETQFRHADGGTVDVRVDLGINASHDDQRLALVVATDITPYKHAHQTLLDSATGQEQQLARQAAKTRAAQQELDEIVTTFLQQLHLPVARALNFLGQVRSAPAELPDVVARPLLNTERAVQQILALLASMDRLMQMRHMRLTIRSVDLDKVLAEVLKNARPWRTVTSRSRPTPCRRCEATAARCT